MKQERDYHAEMRLPEGKTCKDCAYFAQTCRWFLSYTGDETSCDWHPRRYLPLRASVPPVAP